ncbi:MAG: right-handed parallel beta-helix repeat-containing protein [Cytophagales bacterium]
MKTSKLILGTTLVASLLFSCKKKEKSEPTVSSETVSGKVEGIWTSGKTYYISESITVDSGKSLTIQEGANIIMDPNTKPEIIVLGNFYCLGTNTNPIKLSVPDSSKNSGNSFGKLWGGIIAGKSCKEMVIENTILEYGGATTTEESASVKAGLYKAESGENVPAVYFANVDGKLVFRNNTVRNFQEDGLYLEGGQMIIDHNTFYTTGLSGGDAINIKSGVLADVAYNLFYSPNTNALKLSNTGDRTPQAYVVAYNNTIVNAGWRRPDVKGGSIWLEKSVKVILANNLIANCRFGIKRDAKKPEDAASSYNHNYYYGYTQTGVNQFQPSADIVADTIADIRGTEAQQNNPQFSNYPVSTDSSNSTFNSTWDFHLQTSSPAIGKGTTSVTRQFATGITINGIVYVSPAADTAIGAFGTK